MSASVSSTITCPPAEGAHPKLGNYTFLKFLGEGACGKVAKCFNSKTKEVVAVKLFEDDDDMEEELEVIQHLGNIDPDEVNIIKYIEHFTCEKYHCIVYEILDCSLVDLVMGRPEPSLSLSELRTVAQQLLVAFEALKEAQVFHGDLKADNIMLVNHQAQPFRVKLIDFGCGGHLSELEQGTNMMCLAYRAPEVVLGAPLSEALDMWSLGCLLAEGLLGCDLFSYSSKYDHLRTIIHLLGQPSNEMLQRSVFADKYFLQTGSQWRFKSPTEYQETNQKSPKVSECELDEFSDLAEAIMLETNDEDEDAVLDLEVFLDFVKNLLQVDPEKRLPVDQALSHPFITMEHLSYSDSEYVQSAYDLMAVTLKTSRSAPVENPAQDDPEQNLQSSAALLERPGYSLTFEDVRSPPECHNNTSSEHERPEKAVWPCNISCFQVDHSDEVSTSLKEELTSEHEQAQITCRPEEADCTHSPLIEIDEGCFRGNNAVSFITEPVEENNVKADISVSDSSNDLKSETADNSGHKSASFWSGMRKRFGRVIAGIRRTMTRIRRYITSRRR